MLGSVIIEEGGAEEETSDVTHFKPLMRIKKH